MSLTLTILGCGSSGGVPRIGNNWGACDPNNPKNRRLRCSALIEKTTLNGRTRVLIDTSPDLRQQLLEIDVDCLDAVVYTHDHADHTHGIDDLRVIALNAKRCVDVYFDKATGHSLRQRFDYCFEGGKNSDYPRILEGRELVAGEELVVKGKGGKITLVPFLQHHGPKTSLGVRCGKLAYSSDINGLPDAVLPVLENLDVWIVDALRYTEHPSHFSVDQAVSWIAKIAPRRALLTHLHVDLDYDTLSRKIPDGVEVAYDGLVVPFEDT